MQDLRGHFWGIVTRAGDDSRSMELVETSAEPADNVGVQVGTYLTMIIFIVLRSSCVTAL